MDTGTDDPVTGRTPNMSPMIIPFTIERNLPIVSVTIGDRPCSLVVDLGGHAPISLVRSALENTHVRFLGTSSWSYQRGKIIESKCFVVPSMSIHGNQFEDLPGEDRPRLRWDGTLGLGFLSNYVVIFDYRESVVELHPPEADHVLETIGKPIPISMTNAGVESCVLTEYGGFSFHWDTGATLSCLRPSCIGKERSPNWPPPEILISTFELDGQDLGPQKALLHEFARPLTDGIIGSDFFAPRRVGFDFSRSLAVVG